jgi:hypothetical protein
MRGRVARPEDIVAIGLTRVSDIAFDAKGRLDILESGTTGGGVAPASTGALPRATLRGSNQEFPCKVPGRSTR